MNPSSAAERLRRLGEGVEKSQDIYGVEVDEKDRRSVHDAAIKVKRKILDDQQEVISAYIAMQTAAMIVDGKPVDLKMLSPIEQVVVAFFLEQEELHQEAIKALGLALGVVDSVASQPDAPQELKELRVYVERVWKKLAGEPSDIPGDQHPVA